MEITLPVLSSGPGFKLQHCPLAPVSSLASYLISEPPFCKTDLINPAFTGFLWGLKKK